MARVFVLGMAVADFVFAVDDIPQSATKYRASDARIVGGGCAANAAVAVSRLGGTVTLAARLGADPLGDLIAADLARDGVATGMLDRAPLGRSAFSSICVDARGERQIVNFRGEGLCEDTDWIARAPTCDAILVDTRWTNGAAAALLLARQRAVPGVLDAEPPVDPNLLQLASHVAFSRSGLEAVTHESDPVQGLCAFHSDNTAWACVTDGANGVYYFADGQITHSPAPHVTVRDTLAAGDIWHGAFALGLAEGMNEAQAVRLANAAAALKCMEFGGRAGCPDRPTVQDFLKENT